MARPLSSHGGGAGRGVGAGGAGVPRDGTRVCKAFRCDQFHLQGAQITEDAVALTLGEGGHRRAFRGRATLGCDRPSEPGGGTGRAGRGQRPLEGLWPESRRDMDRARAVAAGTAEGALRRGADGRSHTLKAKRPGTRAVKTCH